MGWKELAEERSTALNDARCEIHRLEHTLTSIMTKNDSLERELAQEQQKINDLNHMLAEKDKRLRDAINDKPSIRKQGELESQVQALRADRDRIRAAFEAMSKQFQAEKKANLDRLGFTDGKRGRDEDDEELSAPLPKQKRQAKALTEPKSPKPQFSLSTAQTVRPKPASHFPRSASSARLPTSTSPTALSPRIKASINEVHDLFGETTTQMGTGKTTETTDKKTSQMPSKRSTQSSSRKPAQATSEGTIGAQSPPSIKIFSQPQMKVPASDKKRKTTEQEELEEDLKDLTMSSTPGNLQKRQRCRYGYMGEDDEFRFKAIFKYDNGEDAFEYHTLEDLEDCQFLLDRVEWTKNIWENNKGPVWMFDFYEKWCKAANSQCITTRTAGKRTKWRTDGAGRFACVSCVKHGRPCFTWSQDQEGEWEFLLLPLHTDDRTHPVRKDKTEVRYWLNDYTEFSSADMLKDPEEDDDYVD